jgi:inhibitor of KinA
MKNFADGDARFVKSSDQSLIVYFGGVETCGIEETGRAKARPLQRQDSVAAHESVRRLLRLLETDPIGAVRNVHPGYASVLVKFDALRIDHSELEKRLQDLLPRMEAVVLPKPRNVEIPVCYGGELGPDLEEVAKLHDFSADRVIELHTSQTYLVYFLGFVPGFAYLGELSDELATPRLSNPRKSVPKGSVGIAGNQTGVYPFATPGGWRLLGRTPLKMFQSDRRELSLLAIGDQVKFVPISREQFAEMQNA